MDWTDENFKVEEFEYLSIDEIVKEINELTEYVACVIQMPKTISRILLSHTQWDKQELLDRLTDSDKRVDLFAKAHVVYPLPQKVQVKDSNDDDKVECGICLGEMPRTKLVDLGCGHEYCENCWRQYLTMTIKNGIGAEAISCPTEMCNIVIDDVTVMILLTDETVKRMYNHSITNSYIQGTELLRWCPSPKCDTIIRGCHIFNTRNCTCKCGSSFCFYCGDECHDPIPCILVEKWKENNNDSTIEYITKYTKPCPKCSSSIEKNGGCNHMSCRTCGYDFCWLCFGKWEKHDTDGCRTFERDVAKRMNKKKRYEHHLSHYALHRKSLKFEMELKNTDILSMKVRDLQNRGLSWNESQCLPKAVDILCECRQQLMLMCIFAYCVEEDNQKYIFEANHRDLHLATEGLSLYLENRIRSDSAQDIVQNLKNKSNYCQRRLKQLKEHIYEGYDNNWWTFNTNFTF